MEFLDRIFWNIRLLILNTYRVACSIVITVGHGSDIIHNHVLFASRVST